MKIRLPTILLAILLLTSPCSANGLGNDKAAHITASAAAGIVLVQNKLIGKRTIEIGMENIFTEEMGRINALKKRIEAQDE